MSKTNIYLVPGFFGFTSLGAVNYFLGVGDALREGLSEHGVDARVIQCPTLPTGSFRQRARLLLQTVAETGGLESDSLHFVGHSSGGLDIRLLLTPGVRIEGAGREEAVAARTRTAITVATPHYGTPLANFFTTFQGRRILQVLALLAISSPGRLSLMLGARGLKTVGALSRRLGRRENLVDLITQGLFSEVSLDPTDPIWRFLEQVASDQGAIIQLTPESLDLFNVSVVDNPGIYYASLLTAAPPPPTAFRLADLWPADRAAMSSLFTTIYWIAAQEHRQYPYPRPAMELHTRLEDRLERNLDARSNDGVVPTYSQVWGEVLDAVTADHLDVVGQFRRITTRAYTDWLPSASRFDDEAFHSTWSLVSKTIARHS